jgi:glutamate synthase (NADPH/NADH) small chain
MDFLTRNSKRVQRSHVPEDDFMAAQGLDVLVIGGGNTGSDCIGTLSNHMHRTDARAPGGIRGC